MENITAKEAEKIMVPTQYEYTYNDFLGDGPYEKLYSYFGLPLVMSREVIKMADNAKKVGFIHPETKEYMEFDSPLPEYFERFLKGKRYGIV